MTKNELDTALGNSNTLIKHQNMTDVAFGPLRFDEDSDYYKVTGIWYSFFLESFMGNVFGAPLTETIQIKKKDLDQWQTIPLKS